jgi:hypothetical protein
VSAAMGRRPPLIALLAAVALFAAGCGDKTNSQLEAQTEGLYMDVGPLLYQVQISRYLNPGDAEDRSYLAGLPSGTSIQPGKGETWFGIFMQVRNPSKQTQLSTNDYSVVDTQGAKYLPVPLDRKANPFAYLPEPIAPGGLYPGLETPAFNGPIQGSMVLFKFKTASLQNRPLKLKIDDGAGHVATIDLDL